MTDLVGQMWRCKACGCWMPALQSGTYCDSCRSKGKTGEGESRAEYVERIKNMTRTSRTGLITDYLAHGERPAPDELGVERDTSVVRVQPNEVAPTDKATHERGMSFQGPWETFADGFCEHTRRLARALSLAGVPVHLRSLVPRHRTPVGEDRKVDGLYADLLHASIAEYAGQIQMAVPTPGLLSRLVISKYYTPEQVRYLNDRRVISTVWERQSGIAADDLSALKCAAQAWVACPANRELLVEAGVDEDKVRVVPCPYMPDDPHLALYGRERRPGMPRFYHVGKWEPRKEQPRIIEAFMRAFKPGEALLMLKTSASAPRFTNYPLSPANAIERCLADPTIGRNWTAEVAAKYIIVMARRLTDEQMVELHRMGDVYVTLSRGEGFDMPAFDAKLSGNLMVYTPSGGPQAFAGFEDEIVAQTGTVPCHGFYRWPEGSRYLDYDVIDAARAMVYAASKLKGLDAVQRRGVDLDVWSAEAVGLQMRGYIEELVGAFK